VASLHLDVMVVVRVSDWAAGWVVDGAACQTLDGSAEQNADGAGTAQHVVDRLAALEVTEHTLLPVLQLVWH
jgi:hypothetical protein